MWVTARNAQTQREPVQVNFFFFFFTLTVHNVDDNSIGAALKHLLALFNPYVDMMVKYIKFHAVKAVRYRC